MAALRVGLIGTGYMGKCHALAYRNVGAVFGTVEAPILHTVCDVPAERADRMARQLGFLAATDDWRTVTEHPDIDIVSIATPNGLHKEPALAALAAGKHVWCEKPMALTLEDAQEMTQAAKAAGARGIRTMLGYNYTWNPAFLHTRKLIENGAIGRPFYFRGYFEEDYQADPENPWTWRLRTADAGLGALGDMGCHLVSLMQTLMGPVESLIADMATIHAERIDESGQKCAVENEDIAEALIRFKSGARGCLSTSRVAWGRKNRIAFEVHGDRGQIVHDQERMNELQLFQNGPKSVHGFRTILTSPEHPPFGDFLPGAGHHIGFNDMKPIELRELMTAIDEGREARMGFLDGYEIERVIFAVAESARSDTRIYL